MTSIIRRSNIILANVLNPRHSLTNCHNHGISRSLFTSPTLMTILLKNKSTSNKSNNILGTEHSFLKSSASNHTCATEASYIEDNLKLRIDQKANETYVEAIPTPTGRENRVIENKSGSQACALCRLNLKGLDYTDVKILAQFIKRDGSLVTYHESKLCSAQYRRVNWLIKRAQRCNLLKRPADYLVPGPWHDLNTYLERDRRRDQPMKVVKPEYWKI